MREYGAIREVSFIVVIKRIAEEKVKKKDLIGGACNEQHI